MQMMILRNIFREKWVRKFAKMITADFDPFQVQIGSIVDMKFAHFQELALIELGIWILEISIRYACYFEK